MHYEWDERKRKSNLRKHGIDFVGCDAIFQGATVTSEDTRFDYGQNRFVTLGMLEGRVVYIAHTENDNLIRIISIRKATKREEALYFQTLQNRLGSH